MGERNPREAPAAYVYLELNRPFYCLECATRESGAAAHE